MAEGTLRQSPGQTHIEWKIDDFWKQQLNHSSKKPSKSRMGHFLNSPPFLLSDAEWFITMYPNGQSENDSVGWMSLYLRKGRSATANQIAYRVGIQKVDGSELVAFQMKHTFENKLCIYGWDKFVERSVLLNLVDDVSSDGSLTVFCTARIVHTKDVPSLYSLVTLSKNFKDLYLGRCYSDVTLLVQGKKFFAHRNVLSSRSKVFAAMFEHEMVEKIGGIVDIPDCNPDSFEEFLLFLYSGKDDVTSSNALSLYETADKYDMKELRGKCADCLAREMSVSSFCDIVRLAALHHESNLLQAATNFFIDKAEIIIKTSKWQDFLEESSSLGNELFLKFLLSQQKSCEV